MYGIVRFWKSSIMNVIGTELSEISAHYLKKNVTFDFVYIRSIAYIDQSAPNLGKIFMSNRIWMSSIMGPIGPEQLELFGLKLWKIAAFDFVYSLISANINQSAPNYEHKISDEFDYGSGHTRSIVYLVFIFIINLYCLVLRWAI